ncbi:hypothetical protein EV421DRAFT_1739729 [Armillaria borealis]|uniref:Uncharacterized protein n=1 Tax=Armillaria borealis TaxID=47425 RepID=A0AA39J5Y4_9AGAR|nr:hypothetical protein EV421DRAFT_1739729 [Armillaria borealis]
MHRCQEGQGLSVRYRHIRDGCYWTVAIRGPTRETGGRMHTYINGNDWMGLCKPPVTLVSPSNMAYLQTSSRPYPKTSATPGRSTLTHRPSYHALCTLHPTPYPPKTCPTASVSASRSAEAPPGAAPYGEISIVYASTPALLPAPTGISSLSHTPGTVQVDSAHLRSRQMCAKDRKAGLPSGLKVKVFEVRNVVDCRRAKDKRQYSTPSSENKITLPSVVLKLG